MDWIVVGFHNCAYCSSSRHGSDAGVRDRWTPLFDRYEVDVVINGHNHMYERTHPVRDGKVGVLAPSGAIVHPETDGTTYLVCGLSEDEDRSTDPASTVTYYTGADLGLRVPETTPWSAVAHELVPVVMRAKATPPDLTGRSTLTITSVNAANGEIVDRVTLDRRRHSG